MPTDYDNQWSQVLPCVQLGIFWILSVVVVANIIGAIKRGDKTDKGNDIETESKKRVRGKQDVSN